MMIYENNKPPSSPITERQFALAVRAGYSPAQSTIIAKAEAVAIRRHLAYVGDAFLERVAGCIETGNFPPLSDEAHGTLVEMLRWSKPGRTYLWQHRDLKHP